MSVSEPVCANIGPLRYIMSHLSFLQASLDQPTQTVVMHRTEPTSLQNMALQLAEKLGGLVENNERVFDLKQGVYGGYFNRGETRCSGGSPPLGTGGDYPHTSFKAPA